MRERLPTFARCADGKWYEGLVYQDLPMRRGWFICFSDKEPAELVLREDLYKGGMGPRDILKGRGFESCVKAWIRGRKDPHLRFFGVEKNTFTGEERPKDGHKAISWFLVFKKGAPLPAPTGQDSVIEIYPYYPNKQGVYFGEKT